MLADERFGATGDARQALRDRALTASARAALLANALTRAGSISLAATGGGG
jgi:hypothetical protein